MAETCVASDMSRETVFRRKASHPQEGRIELYCMGPAEAAPAITETRRSGVVVTLEPPSGPVKLLAHPMTLRECI